MKKVVASILLLFLLMTTGCVQSIINPDVEAHDKIPEGFLNDNTSTKEFDVIVIGGEPEGVAAALSAARNGANTLLIEERDNLGGLFTFGKMNVLDFPHGINNNILSSGIFEEWHRMVGNDKSFEIEEAKNAFLNMVYDQGNLSMLLNAEVKGIEVKNEEEITTISILKNNKNYTLKANNYIDATQDADIAYLSGVPYFIGAEDVGHKERLMAVTLMIHLKDVNWGKIKDVAKKETFGPAEVTREAAWGFAKLRDMYKPQDPNMRLRGFNLIRNDEGYYINALQIFGVDGLDEDSKQKGIERGKKEINYILDWLKVNFPGFEKAKVASYPSELYVRETRHINSLYQLPVSDLWENKYHWDTIAYGGYPSDIQATAVNDPGAIVVNPTQYGIPFRSLVPQKLTNLLVVGRSGGYSSLAQGSVRIVPTGMATGEAAGAAGALATKKNLDFHSMAKNKEAITELQEDLAQQGALVKEFDIPFPYENVWYYPAIRELLNHRALFGGYQNDLLEDQVASNKSLSNILLHTYIAERNKNPNYEQNIQYLSQYYAANDTFDLTVEEIINIIEGLPYKDFDRSYLEEIRKVENTEPITREHIYIIVGKLFGWI